jgi:hypothetical protein
MWDITLPGIAKNDTLKMVKVNGYEDLNELHISCVEYIIDLSIYIKIFIQFGWFAAQKNSRSFPFEWEKYPFLYLH